MFRYKLYRGVGGGVKSRNQCCLYCKYNRIGLSTIDTLDTENKINTTHVYPGCCTMQRTRGVNNSTRIQVTSIVVVKKWMQQKYASKINRQDLYSLLLLVHEHVRGILDLNLYFLIILVFVIFFVLSIIHYF